MSLVPSFLSSRAVAPFWLGEDTFGDFDSLFDRSGFGTLMPRFERSQLALDGSFFGLGKHGELELVQDSPAEFVVQTVVPASLGKDLDVTVDEEKRMLHIKGKQDTQHEEKDDKGNVVRTSSSSSQFVRHVSIPEGVDVDAAKAKLSKLKDDKDFKLLRLVLPKNSQQGQQ